VAKTHGKALLLLLSVFMAAAAGCHRKDKNAVRRETSHVRLLTNLHALASSKLGHVPHDEQEFKKSIATLSVSAAKLKVGSIDELFISERDGQPLVVIYGSLPAASDVVVYEQIGVEGKRQVGHKIGMVEEVDEAQYKLLTASKH
jgi:thioredoxin-related protein